MLSNSNVILKLTYFITKSMGIKFKKSQFIYYIPSFVWYKILFEENKKTCKHISRLINI